MVKELRQKLEKRNAGSDAIGPLGRRIIVVVAVVVLVVVLS